MAKPFVNLADVEFDDVEENGYYTSRRARFSAGIGARRLGYNLTELPPGKAQCPFHSHREEEEMFLILEGEGELRFGDQRLRAAQDVSRRSRRRLLRPRVHGPRRNANPDAGGKRSPSSGSGSPTWVAVPVERWPPVLASPDASPAQRRPSARTRTADSRWEAWLASAVFHHMAGLRRPTQSRRHVQPGIPMTKLRVESFTISLDGFGAGPNQDLDNPLGVGGTSLHGWAVSTRTFRKMVFGTEGGATEGIDEAYAARGFRNVGAWILGRNMFGPVRGPWPDETWRGWWGENPVYHVPVFVVTHHARPPLVMEGGTTFHFVTDGIDAALARAREAAGGKDVRLGGGVDVIQQYLRARLVDEMHVAIAPVLLGAGERLFEGLNLPALGYACTSHEASPLATHVVLTRQ